MAFSLELDVRDWLVVLADGVSHRLRLVWRDNLVLKALQEDHRAVEAVGVMDG